MKKIMIIRRMLGYLFLGACVATLAGIIFFCCTLGNQIDVFVASDNYNYTKQYSQYEWQANDEYEEYVSLNQKLKEEGNIVSKWFFNQSSLVKYGLDMFFVACPFIAFYAWEKNKELREKQRKLRMRARNAVHSKNLRAR